MGLQESVFMSDLQPIRVHQTQRCGRTEKFSPILLPIWAGKFPVVYLLLFFYKNVVILGSGLRIIRRSAVNCSTN